MEKELIISAQLGSVEIALLEDKKLVELHKQKANTQYNVGDIFLGQIKKLMPGLNAAFVDIGHKKESFLHYTDMGPLFNSDVTYTQEAMEGKYTSSLLEHFELKPEIHKNGKVSQITDKRVNLLVQILKEPISTKGHRLTCEITIPGRFLVLTPFSNTIAISKKIANTDERNRLFHVVESIRPKNFGIVVRTAAEGKKVAEMHEEINMLCEKWKVLHSQLYKAKAPMKLLSELDKTSSIIRDLLNPTFTNIVVNDRDIFEGIKIYLENNLPEKTNIVQFYKGSKPIFEHFGVKRQIKHAFGQTATLSSGAYVVIEHTEAMHVVDVNSGPKSQRLDQENAALQVNVEAAEEIARQLRLRDIGGLIVIDFIDMKNNDNKVELYNAMKKFMEQDRSQHTILPLSKFGLMQITRQRERQELKLDTSEVCPSCTGTGKVNASIFLVDMIEKDLDFILSTRPTKHLVLEVHPYVAAFLKKGFWNYSWKWYFKHHKKVKIRENQDLPLIEFKFFDGPEEEIRFKA
ncbi:MAG: Rne/Rng family ribonuclease [Saprospiraceae bacterium]|nr:Rne/Rng family ribonuclease [Saprospiraceae bacterium]MBK8485457.1 Rne/Rng family ribonuclease [Saprospiraceae bacterium]MBK9222684.1 Rne/Rng family ribonuclease [Saprospiraceae bacterium]MBK9720271.1 Rne/Rng family ribonuclease [Saprospiraceae bacterium]MBK9727266.1 Rne/Rng family ribonuclease [Saprospiraceae bacterium]